MKTNPQTSVIKGNKHPHTNQLPETRLENKMKITASSLIRWSGLSAMVAGILFIVIQTIHPADILSSVTTGRWAIVHYLSIAMCLLGLLGIAGIYARQVEEAGWLLLSPARHYGDLRQASGRGRLAWSGRLSHV